MAAVDLSDLPIVGVEHDPLDFGGPLTPVLGGPIQHIERLGSRWSMQLQTPTLDWEPDGRRWAARLRKAKREGAVVVIPQPELVVGNPGNPVVATNIASGRLVPLSGMTAGYVIREGQWLSVIVAGQRYADRAEAEAVVNGAGAVTVTIQNLLRVPLAGGETVEIAAPKLQGSILGNYGGAIDVDGHTSFAFVVQEDA